MSKTFTCICWKIAYLGAVSVYPYVYQQVAQKVMATYEYKWAAAVLALILVLGVCQAVSQRMAVFCAKGWLIGMNTIILGILLAINIIGWFNYVWFSTTMLLCAAIAIMDFILAIVTRPISQNSNNLLRLKL